MSDVSSAALPPRYHALRARAYQRHGEIQIEAPLETMIEQIEERMRKKGEALLDAGQHFFRAMPEDRHQEIIAAALIEMSQGRRSRRSSMQYLNQEGRSALEELAANAARLARQALHATDLGTSFQVPPLFQVNGVELELSELGLTSQDGVEAIRHVALGNVQTGLVHLTQAALHIAGNEGRDFVIEACKRAGWDPAIAKRMPPRQETAA